MSTAYWPSQQSFVPTQYCQRRKAYSSLLGASPMMETGMLPLEDRPAPPGMAVAVSYLLCVVSTLSLFISNNAHMAVTW